MIITFKPRKIHYRIKEVEKKYQNIKKVKNQIRTLEIQSIFSAIFSILVMVLLTIFHKEISFSYSLLIILITLTIFGFLLKKNYDKIEIIEKDNEDELNEYDWQQLLYKIEKLRSSYVN